jgi:hypothetical protein
MAISLASSGTLPRIRKTATARAVRRQNFSRGMSNGLFVPGATRAGMRPSISMENNPRQKNAPRPNAPPVNNWSNRARNHQEPVEAIADGLTVGIGNEMPAR